MELLLSVALSVLGLTTIVYVLWDVFQTVVVPRPSPTRIRLARLMTRRTWAITKAVANGRSPERRDRLLGMYAPLQVLLLLVAWIALLILGYALILYALRTEIRPEFADFGTALYYTGESLLTIGYGEFVATGALSRIAVIAAAGTGLGVVALTVTYLFSLYGSFQRREVLVVTLEARAGSPPSAVAMLETYAKLDMLDDLPRTFREWEVWCAELLDSHIAYPILTFFRSSHDNASWISALGCVMDAATLVMTTVEGIAIGPAKTMEALGRHFIEDVGRLFKVSTRLEPLVERSEFDEVRARLAAAGLRVRPDPEASWQAFAKHRSAYAVPLNAMAAYWLSPPALWIGDRSLVARPFGGLPAAHANPGPAPTAKPAEDSQPAYPSVAGATGDDPAETQLSV
jgi:hypothetical protein